MSTISYPNFLNFSNDCLKFSSTSLSTPSLKRCQGTPIFLPFLLEVFLSTFRKRSGTEVLSSLSYLDKRLKIILVSFTHFPNGETWSSEFPIAIIPCLDTAPYVGLSPTKPQKAAGSRTDPQVSVPSAARARFPASAAAEPPEEPPAPPEEPEGSDGR